MAVDSKKIERLKADLEKMRLAIIEYKKLFEEDVDTNSKELLRLSTMEGVFDKITQKIRSIESNKMSTSKIDGAALKAQLEKRIEAIDQALEPILKFVKQEFIGL